MLYEIYHAINIRCHKFSSFHWFYKVFRDLFLIKHIFNSIFWTLKKIILPKMKWNILLLVFHLDHLDLDRRDYNPLWYTIKNRGLTVKNGKFDFEYNIYRMKKVILNFKHYWKRKKLFNLSQYFSYKMV